MFQAILSARRSIYLEMYIFSDDMVQYDFLNLLKEKAAQGLHIHILLDSLGSSDLGKEAVAELRKSGAEVLFHSYYLFHNHRKILVVDEKSAFIGGVNISQRFRFWNDLVVEVRGKKLVKHIIRSFAKAYVESKGKDKGILSKNKPIVLDKTRTWLIEHFPARRKSTLKKIYKENLNAAKEYIILVTPYFAPKRFMIKALRRAVKRGVRVDVLVPQKTDIFFIDRVNYFYMFRLAKYGVNFYLEPIMNHAKVMLIDSKEGIVGSQNLDFISFDLNNEIGVFFKDEDIVKRLSEILDSWKKNAFLFNRNTYKPTRFDYVLSPLIRIFAKIF
jgi:cardiolipin synthase